jgi:tetratricopeptide (TPR) repeat protein
MSSAAVLLAVSLALFLLHARQRPAPHLPTRATWALPETDAERRLLEAGDGPRASDQLGRYYLEAGRPFAAVWQFQEALTSSNAGRRTDDNRPPTADRGAGTAGGRRPGTAGGPRSAIVVRLAQALRQGGWYGPAERTLGPLVAAEPGNITARQQLAAVYLATGRPRQAAPLLAPGLGPRSASPAAVVSRAPRELLLLLGDACQAAGDAPAARAAYERAVRELPDDAEPLFCLGRLLLDEGEATSAADLFRRAAALRPMDPRFPVHLGRALMRRGDPASLQAAGRHFADAAAMAPGDVQANLQLGIFHQQQHRWREAGHAFLSVLKLDPDNAEAHRLLGELMHAMDEPARAHYHRGWAFVFEDRPQDAVAEFRAMAAADPASVEAPLLISQGYVEMVQDEDDRAVEVVKEALAKHSRDPRLYGRLASLFFITHDSRAAAELCADWRRFQPEAAEPFWLEGKLAVADHRLDEGIRLLGEAVAREPAHAEYAFELGETLARRPSAENLRRALEALGRAVSLAPDTPRYRYQLAIVLERLGELDGSRRQLLRVLDQDPTNVPAVNSLVRVAQAIQRSDQARFWAPMVTEIEARVQEATDLRRRVGRQPEDADGEMALARLLIQQGALARAQGHLERALSLRPRSEEIRAQHAMVVRSLSVLER